MNARVESAPAVPAEGRANAQPPGGFASTGALCLPARPALGEALGEAKGGAAAFEVRTGARPRAEPAFLESRRFDEPDAEDVTPLLTPDLAAWAWPARWGVDAGSPEGDVAVFQRALAQPASDSPLQLDTLAGDLADRIDAKRMAPLEDCAFDLEVPGHGRLEGRMSLRQGSVEVELRATRNALGGVLRTRRQELERLVDRESGGDVRLFIV